MAVLRQTKGPGSGVTMPLGEEPVAVGRSPQCELQVPDINLSRRHFQVYYQTSSGAYVLQDLGSRNGTFVGGRDVSKCPPDEPFQLSDKEEIVAGACSFVLELENPSQEQTQKAMADISQFISSPSRVFTKLPGQADQRLEALSEGLHLAFDEVLREDLLDQLSRLLLNSLPHMTGLCIFLALPDGELENQGWKSLGGGKPQTPPPGLLEHVMEGHEVRLKMDDSHIGLAVPVRSGRGMVAGVLFAVATNLMTDQEQEDAQAFLAAFGNLAGLSLGYQEMLDRMSQEVRLRNRLQRFLSPEIVEKLRDENEEDALPGGSSEIITVLFADIHDFHGLCEALPADVVFDIVNTVLGEMTNIVLEHHGTLDKYLGDGLMAIFGAPIPFQDHALMAARCARRMQVEMDELNGEFHLGGRPQLKLGISLNTGRCIVGNLGSRERMDYTAVGLPVHEAATLTRLTKLLDIPILAGRDTVEGLGGRIQTGKIDAGSVPEVGIATDIYWIDPFKGETQ